MLNKEREVHAGGTAPENGDDEEAMERAQRERILNAKKLRSSFSSAMFDTSSDNDSSEEEVSNNDASLDPVGKSYILYIVCPYGWCFLVILNMCGYAFDFAFPFAKQLLAVQRRKLKRKLRRKNSFVCGKSGLKCGECWGGRAPRAAQEVHLLILRSWTMTKEVSRS